MKEHEICISAISPITNNIRLKTWTRVKVCRGENLKKFSPPALDPTWSNIMKREITNATAQTQKKKKKKKKRDRRRKGRLFS